MFVVWVLKSVMEKKFHHTNPDPDPNPDYLTATFSLWFCPVALGFISNIETQLKGAQLFIPPSIINSICQY